MGTPFAAYAPSVDQPPSTAAATSYGGFWIRFAAVLVDSVILGIAMMAIVGVWMLVVGWESALEDETPLNVMQWVMTLAYQTFFLSSARMATPGKRLCGLYVTDLGGRRLSFGHVLLRQLAMILSFLTLGIGFLMAGVTERKQALHDKIAGTLVHRQPGTSTGTVLAIGAAAMVFITVVFIGIVIAVGVPLYMEYALKAKVGDVVEAMNMNKLPMRAYLSDKDKGKGKWPTTWQQVASTGGFDPIKKLSEATREIVEEIRLDQAGVMVASVKIEGKQGQIRVTPTQAGGKFEWTCTSSPEIRKHVPPECREQAGQP